ncbi:hypothetical protein V493_03017 [Pseudogymnoascus sp. VKM F-4281 (FW-2241)]|nr:hypothetical protein V493_03017 [Pseudogymnoascus sp. VKM F-4281 (FW-2241)]
MSLILHPRPGGMPSKARNRKRKIEADEAGEDVEAAGSATIDRSCTYLLPWPSRLPLLPQSVHTNPPKEARGTPVAPLKYPGTLVNPPLLHA